MTMETISIIYKLSSYRFANSYIVQIGTEIYMYWGGFLNI